MKKILCVSLLLTTTCLHAEQPPLDISKLYVGASLTHNVIDSPFGGRDLDANGVGLFAGYEFDNDMDQINTYLEVGYSQTDDFFDNEDINGLWVSGLLQKTLPEIDPRLSVLARLGLDFGDDDGLFLGAGGAFQLTPHFSMRAEYINKDATTVYQLGGVIHF